MSAIKPDAQAPVLTGYSDLNRRAEILRLEDQIATKDARIAELEECVGAMSTHLQSMTAMTRAVDKLEGKPDPEEHYLRKELTRRVSVTHTDKSGEPSSTSPPRLSRGGSQIGRNTSTPLLSMTDLPGRTAPETHKPSPSFTSMGFQGKTTPEPNRPSPAVTSIESQRGSTFECGRLSLFYSPMGFLRDTTGLYVPSTRPLSTEGPKNTGEPLYSSKRSTPANFAVDTAPSPTVPPKPDYTQMMQMPRGRTPSRRARVDFAQAQMTHTDFSAKREAEHQAHPRTKRQRHSPRPREVLLRGGATGRGDSSSNKVKTLSLTNNAKPAHQQRKAGLESTRVTVPATMEKPIESAVKNTTGGTAPLVQAPNVDTAVATPTAHIRQEILADEDKKSSGVIKGDAPTTPGPVQVAAPRYKKNWSEEQLAACKMFGYEPPLMSDEDETEVKVQTVAEPVAATPESPAKVVERGHQSAQSTTASSKGLGRGDQITESPKPAPLSHD